ncbi:anti-sigma B factor antagonist [Veronia nyctiphanis]|uniref:Anti-sigma B factor antagonist n=1 Tax=Veronia nyctiphanis TaxID=1278244 RepID=A0A4Q0YM57_9GAMM|nr:STAS domain-containing protein [Veronia nyctiphanis]RXJ71917.1 anti-sigma B factor antagonist [Veronia nyctiphanis]
MKPLELVKKEDGSYFLIGELDRNTVPAFWQQRASWLPDQQNVNLNLSQLKRVDSAGMAMLLHLKNELNNNRQQLVLLGVPEQLKVLLTLSNVDAILNNDAVA